MTAATDKVHIAIHSHRAPDESHSHIEELLTREREAREAGARVVLTHEIRPDTVALLPDLIRYIDDTLSEVDGIAFSLSDDMNGPQSTWWPWWQAAISACEAREVGLRWEDPRLGPPREELKEPPPSEPDVEPETLSLVDTHARDWDWDELLAELIRPLGNWARFVNPARIDLAPDVLDAFCQEEPRDHARVHRAARLRPWVYLNLGELNPDGEGIADLALVDALLRRFLTLDTIPHVGCVVPDTPATSAQERLDGLAALCASHAIPWLPISSSARTAIARTGDEGRPRWTLASPHPDRAGTTIAFDFTVSITAVTEAPLVTPFERSLAAIPDPARRDILASLVDEIAKRNQGAKSDPPSRWLSDHLDASLAERDIATYVGLAEAAPDNQYTSRLPSSERAFRREGAAVDLVSVSCPELWIATIDGLGVVMASTDPLPMDRFVLDAFGCELDARPAIAKAEAIAYPYGRHEGALLVGSMRDEVITGPVRLPKARPGAPLTILGIACTTLANHAAVLVRDGEVVAAVQEERLRRQKQIGWHPEGRPEDTVVCDSALRLEQAYPHRAIAAVLEEANLGWDDIDCLAFNGVPARYFSTYSLTDPQRPPQTVKAGRHLYVPHHLAHAASAYRVSGFDDAFIFTVDGRGERETAAFFEATGGTIRRVYDIRCGEPAEALIGGVYEYITTILGFGHYGQGSTMGLAALGQPKMDLSDFLSARNRDDYRISDRGIFERFGHLARDRSEKLTPEHIALAASVQHALEEAVLNLIEDGLRGRQARNLCLAGGVTLNCSMNQRIRTAFGVENIFVQPAAHDAGTALGAALEAHWEITGERCGHVMRSASLGLARTEAEITRTLERFQIPYERPENIAETVAHAIEGGEVICWYQGRSEFGPRALGSRSIVADPRRSEIKDRLNRMKGRQKWRPLGPSILAGHEAEYFELAFESPFMLFTFPVKTERRSDIPAVLHYDGTTRPQSVTPDANPLYYEMIRAFYTLTGVPMVVNTSFNTAFEPIVERPEDAIASFLDLGADGLAIGPFLVRRPSV